MTAVILCSLLTGVIGAAATQEMKTSAEAIRILKLEEGFSSKPYWDYAQWTVGYGTRCPDDKLEYYKKNGITEEEAEELLRVYVASFESELDKFLTRTGVTLNQSQYDALVLFSYNCGSAWSYDKNGGLYNAIVGRATGNELIHAFSRWCNAGGQVMTGLLRRRLCEANMYLNGVYSQKAPDHFGYILYDAHGGSASPNVQGYDTELTANILSKAVREGYTLDGWYTAKTGGRKVTVLDASVKNSRLYARWMDANGNNPDEEVRGIQVIVSGNGVNVRQGPGLGYQVVGAANTGDQLLIVDTAVADGYTWGKFSDGWICLQYTNYNLVTAPEPEKPTPVMGTVKVSDLLRIRSGPSTGYSVVGSLKNGDRVQILEQKLVGTMLWGKIDKGWVSMSYVVLDQPEEETPPVTEPEHTEPPTTEPPVTEPPATDPPQETLKPTPQVWSGTVKVTTTPLRIRSGPSTATAVVGYLTNGDRVTITEKTNSGTMVWGKIDKGWISLDYVVLDQADTGSQPEKLTGVVKVDSLLRVRQGPGSSYAITAYLSNQTKVEITEQRKVGETLWGKIDKGWISLDYVVLDKQSSGTGIQTVTKTVTASCLRIRSSASTNAKIVGYLYNGTKVQILETKRIGTTTWGRISKGWISLDYVK